MRRRDLAGLLSLCLALGGACSRQPPPAGSPFAGTWVMTLNGHPFTIVSIREEVGRYSGELSRADFNTSDFVQFTGLGHDVRTEPIKQGEIRDGRLHFVTVDPRDNESTELEMWRDGENTARIKITSVPVPIEGMPFTRSSGPAPAVFTGWESGCAYRAGGVEPSNPEMQKIYEADQAPRQDPGKLSAADWKEINSKDEERRTQTRALLTAGGLHTGDDFKQAAFVFQHGSSPDDYLLAHTLATVAVARGEASAAWIMTATLDRYLQTIGKAQIYGTQFKQVPAGATQEPYDRALISDALRRELGVPTLAAQQVQQQDFAKQFQAAGSK